MTVVERKTRADKFQSLLKPTWRRIMATSLFLFSSTLPIDCNKAIAQSSIWSAYHSTGKKFVEQSEYAKAEKVLNLAIREAEKDPDGKSQVIESLKLLEKVCKAQGKFNEARDIRKRIASSGGEEQTQEYPGEDPGENPAALANATQQSGEKSEFSTAEEGATFGSARPTNIRTESIDRPDTRPTDRVIEPEKHAETQSAATANVDSPAETQPVKESPSRPKPEEKPLVGNAGKKEQHASEAKTASNPVSEKSSSGKEEEPKKTNTESSFEISLPDAEADDDQRKADEENSAPQKSSTRTIASTVGIAGEFRHATDSRGAKNINKLDGHIGWTKSLRFFKNGDKALSGSADDTMRLWDLNAGKELRRFEGHTEDVNCVEVSPSEDLAVSASTDKTVRVWSLETGMQTQQFEGHTNIVTCAAFSPDGATVASGSYDGTIRLWSLSSGKEVRVLKVDDPTQSLDTVRCLAFTPDGQLLVSGGSDRMVSVWRVSDGTLLKRLSGHKGDIVCLDISSDGRRALSASRDLSLRLWDLQTGNEERSLIGHGNWIVRARFLKGDKQAISGSLDKTFRIWNLDSGKEAASYTLQDFGMWSLDFSRDATRALTGSNDFSLRLWQVDL